MHQWVFHLIYKATTAAAANLTKADEYGHVVGLYVAVF